MCQDSFQLRFNEYLVETVDVPDETDLSDEFYSQKGINPEAVLYIHRRRGFREPKTFTVLHLSDVDVAANMQKIETLLHTATL